MENVYLTGFMGAGKSTVGRLLARRLGRGFIDTDSRVESRAGASIPELFKNGRFRRVEREVVRAVSREKGLVVALGGGALLDPRNQRDVLATGPLICLTCAEPVLWKRLKPEREKRPLLADGRAAVRKLLKERKKIYALAQMKVSTTTNSPQAAAKLIARRLGRA
jgi:shikimate kinase